MELLSLYILSRTTLKGNDQFVNFVLTPPKLGAPREVACDNTKVNLIVGKIAPFLVLKLLYF